MTEAYPLAWPPGFPRTPAHERKSARFGKRVSRGKYNIGTSVSLTVADARDRLFAELERLGAAHVVLSTNLTLRNDGPPRSGQRDPDDPAVAVYFHLKGRPHCMPCDKWNTVADNMAAVAATIDAQRSIDRWGVGDVERAFAGFAALPPPMTTPAPRPWRSVLGFGEYVDMPSEPLLKTAWRDAVKAAHPDAGGSDEELRAVNLAYEQAKAELRYA